jgi:uncharacterized repeat protein (TIGR01451 family)
MQKKRKDLSSLFGGTQMFLRMAVKRIVAILGAILCFTIATAAEQSSVQVVLSAAKVVRTVNPKGEVSVKYEAPKTVLPGDEIIYTITYSNRKEEPVNDVVITNPIAREMAYKPDSASGQETKISFSVDNGLTYDAPEKLRVKTQSGLERPARPADYTHVRWLLTRPLLAAQGGKVNFAATVK